MTATAKANANCRSGPGGNFDFLATLNQGESARIIGTNTVGDTWWQLELSDGTKCWVKGDSLTLTGNTDNIPEVASPNTPTPVPPASLWAGKWTVWQNQCLNNALSCEWSGTITWTMTSPTTITGTYSALGCNYVDVLIVSADGMRADGRETSSNCSNWDVHLVMDPNRNQFRGRWNQVGNITGDGYYCGARVGYSKPVPERP